MTSSKSIFALLALLGIALPEALAQDWLPPRIRPTSERSVDVPAWEVVSASPFGGSRQGGSDQRQFAFSPDGKLLATEDPGGWQLEMWNTETGKSLGRFGQIDDPVSLAFSPDGKQLLSAEHSGYREVLGI